MTAIVQIKVTPNASKNQIVDWKEKTLYVRIKGVPEKGQVNEELVRFLAKELGIGKSHIELISGHTSRFKRLKIEGLHEKDLEMILIKKIG